MKRLKRLIINCFVFCIHGYLVPAQNINNELVEKLGQVGFENIRVLANCKTLTLSYENNIYREKVNALKEVLNHVTNCGYDTVNVITLINDLPILLTQSTSVSSQQYLVPQRRTADVVPVSLSYNTYKEWNQIKHIIPNSPSFNKINLVFYPQFYQMNVIFSQIYELQFNLAPALEISLWRGMRFTGQVIFPVYNDKLYGAEGDRVRTGFLTLAQEFRLPGSTFGRAVIGKFNAGRYGTDLTMIHYFSNGKVFLSANAGLTGSYRFFGNRWYRDDLNVFTWFLKSGYFFKPFQLQFDLVAGRYLNGDYGLRADCSRYWGETVIGFYAMVAGGHINGGFHFAIPLWPKKLKRNRFFQPRTPGFLDWEYNAATESYFGQYYETRPDENRTEYFYNPDFILKNLLK